MGGVKAGTIYVYDGDGECVFSTIGWLLPDGTVEWNEEHPGIDPDNLSFEKVGKDLYTAEHEEFTIEFHIHVEV